MKRACKKMTVGILSGGISEERFLSVRAGDYISWLLVTCGFSCVRIDWCAIDKWSARDSDGFVLGEFADLKSLLSIICCECIVDLFCGKEEICYKADLAVKAAGIPYVGNSWQASFTGSDKISVKRICRELGFPSIPAVILLPKESLLDSVLQHCEYPCFIKPVSSGSSIGTGIITGINDGIHFLSTIPNSYYPLILEKKITGKEYSCGVVRDSVTGLPTATEIAEISYDSVYFDAKTKANNLYRVTVDPPALPRDTVKKMQSYAYALHNAIGAEFSTRVDFIVDTVGAIHILEINTHPGMGKHSILPPLIEEKFGTLSQYLEKLITTMIGN